MRQMLAETFAGQGYEVVQETDSSVVISKVIEVNPDILILAEASIDHERSGAIQLLRRLTDGIMVIIGDSEGENAVAALLEGADIFITKPVNYRDLLARVQAFLRRSDLDHSA